MFKSKSERSHDTIPGWSHRAGDYAIELLGIEDPYLTEQVGPHASSEYRAGLERLLSFDFRVRNLSRSKDNSVCVGWFRLEDDEGYSHQCLGLDLRHKEPRFLEGIVAPEAAVRGWLTFALPRDRQARRIVFFSGYLMGKTAAFELPQMTTEQWEEHFDAAKRAWARRQVARELAERDAELQTQELRAAALAGHAERLEELERREAAIGVAGVLTREDQAN